MDELAEELNGINVESELQMEETESVNLEETEPEPIKPEIVILPPDNSLPTYISNNDKENLILQYAENFRRQFVHLYRDRKPLFIQPMNEYGIEKLVCTTIRPTLLPYKELYDWDECAKFVCDYLTYLPLQCPNELPPQLPSPTHILKSQKGNCFDFSTLLCSLLIAAGYDAYCVCGYATRELTLMDQTRDVCPILETKEEKTVGKVKQVDNKYDVKPPRDLRSKYLIKMEERRIKQLHDEEERIKEAELARISELEKPPPDDLYGMRIHCWVLVLAGKREVPENFFIEPSTGICSESHNYLGIEALWNNSNYWVNMQDCSHGIGNMSFDLADIARWEYMFSRSDKPLLTLPGEEDYEIHMDDDDEELEDEIEMPISWVNEIVLPLEDIQRRCPEGKKTILYRKAKHEIFAEYLMQDGMVSRLTEYEDNALTQPLRLQEWFKHRQDKLEHRKTDLVTNKVVETFNPGRRQALREHIYYSNQTGSEANRSMKFDFCARTDGLTTRDETPVQMTEYFKDRDDFLTKRNVDYSKRQKRFGPAGKAENKPIHQITEYYARDDSLSADDDIAELTFLLSEERIIVKHHLQQERIVAATKEFLKPPQTENKGLSDLTPDVLTAFQVERGAKNPKLVHVYTMLTGLLDREAKCVDFVRQSEQEVRMILDRRTQEELTNDLNISIYDTARNDTAKKRREELERKKREDEARREEMELDYLAPFLARIGDPEVITLEIAKKLKEECLQDLKKRLIDMANLIQGRYEKETYQLKQKQSWYQQNQTTMTKEEEEEYSSSCSEDYFKIQILEQRLNRHKELAPQKYLALESRLRSDTRLSDFLN